MSDNVQRYYQGKPLPREFNVFTFCVNEHHEEMSHEDVTALFCPGCGLRNPRPSAQKIFGIHPSQLGQESNVRP